VSPAYIHVGDKVTFTYSVKNLGTSTLPDGTYDVDFYINGVLVSFDHATSSLIPGGSVSYSMAAPYYHFDAKAPGQYNYKVVVDPTNRVQETDESNNVVLGSFVVHPKAP
jgi:subtilase family serine protease